jgi:hypothetical protein
MHILDEARAEADKIIADARLEREKFVENGNAALQLASRDVLLRVREACLRGIQEPPQAAGWIHAAGPKFLEELILEIARKAQPEHSTKACVSPACGCCDAGRDRPRSFPRINRGRWRLSCWD